MAGRISGAAQILAFRFATLDCSATQGAMKVSRELEKVLAHAESRLAPTGTRRPTEVLPLYKKFLKVEEHRLRLRHQAGGGGREICARRAELVDVLLRYVFGAASSAAARENGLCRSRHRSCERRARICLIPTVR